MSIKKMELSSNTPRQRLLSYSFLFFPAILAVSARLLYFHHNFVVGGWPASRDDFPAYMDLCQTWDNRLINMWEGAITCSLYMSAAIFVAILFPRVRKFFHCHRLFIYAYPIASAIALGYATMPIFR